MLVLSGCQDGTKTTAEICSEIGPGILVGAVTLVNLLDEAASKGPAKGQRFKLCKPWCCNRFKLSTKLDITLIS